MGGDDLLVANTDPTGEMGRRVAERLVHSGVRQRLIIQDPSSKRSDLPNAEWVFVDSYADQTGMKDALAGVDTLFLVPIRERPDRALLHRSAVDAAVAARVQRIVYSSFLGATANSTFTLARDHYATEQRLRSSGVDFTILRGGPFMEVLRWIIGDDGVIRGPAGQGRLAPVARDDLADVITAIITAGDPHLGLTYDITGPGSLTLDEIAAEFSTVTGRRISYLNETLEQARASRRSHDAPQWQLDAWISTYLQIASGELDVVSDAVMQLTGHLPVSLTEFLAAHPESYEELLRR